MKIDVLILYYSEVRLMKYLEGLEPKKVFEYLHFQSNKFHFLMALGQFYLVKMEADAGYICFHHLLELFQGQKSGYHRN